MIILNIGSNLDSIKGDRFFNLKKTLELIKLENIYITKLSSIYETPSYPNEKNPKFLNMGLEIECNYSPKYLIKKFNIIEKKLQRTRGMKNQPRTCDIDLIDYEGEILNSKNLTIPHPKAHLRNFVLFPIKEISPTWIHPILNKKIDSLIKKLSFKLRNEITRIKESVIIEQ
jgi:2-amino-4-hydroxy-6-hydroxymethyldihydropteridine diphosphokinase